MAHRLRQRATIRHTRVDKIVVRLSMHTDLHRPYEHLRGRSHPYPTARTACDCTGDLAVSARFPGKRS